jgi:hypothetical protein
MKSRRALHLIPVILMLEVTAAFGDTPGSAVHDLPLFTIGKSQNRNQVQYAVHVDDHCVPNSGAPVFAYWHMFEVGPNRVAALLKRELEAYGIAYQHITVRYSNGGQVSLALRALPERPILVKTFKEHNGSCRALATLAITSKPAQLFDVYVKLNWHLGVDYLLLRGWSMDRTQILSEKLAM